MVIPLALPPSRFSGNDPMTEESPKVSPFPSDPGPVSPPPAENPPAVEAAANGAGAAPPPQAPPDTGPAPAHDDEPAPEAASPPDNKRWYVVKVQSGREESIKEAIERRVKIEGLQDYFEQIIIPVERVTEVRVGKRVVKERKLYPGYLMVQVEYNDSILYLFRETSGVGDFVGGTQNHPPQPMKDHEVERMLGSQGVLRHDAAPPKPRFEKGDKVKVKDGTFAGMEGEVKELLEAKGAVRVELTIWGRPVPVELEYWQVEL